MIRPGAGPAIDAIVTPDRLRGRTRTEYSEQRHRQATLAAATRRSGVLTSPVKLSTATVGRRLFIAATLSGSMSYSARCMVVCQ